MGSLFSELPFVDRPFERSQAVTELADGNRDDQVSEGGFQRGHDPYRVQPVVPQEEILQGESQPYEDYPHQGRQEPGALTPSPRNQYQRHREQDCESLAAGQEMYGDEKTHNEDGHARQGQGPVPHCGKRGHSQFSYYAKS